MKKKNTEVKTKRMVLQPMSEEEIMELIEHTRDEKMQKAYGEMLDGSRQDPENKASQRVLEKCGFVPDGTGKEGPRFVVEAPLENWSMIYMCFGMSIGIAIGSGRDQMVMGMSIGMGLGLCIGMLMTASARKEREKLRQKRKTGE